MAESSGFFNAQLNPDGVTYDRVYLADNFAAYFAHFIGNGVYVNPATSLQVIRTEPASMSVKVKVGSGFINGYWYNNSTELVKTIAAAGGTTNRIDTVVLRWDSVARTIVCAVVQGNPYGDVAQPKPLIREGSVYEIALAHISIPKGLTSVADSNIIDVRGDNAYCGYVSGLIDQIETTDLFTQFQSEFDSWFNGIKNTLGSDIAGSLQNQIDEINTHFTNGFTWGDLKGV